MSPHRYSRTPVLVYLPSGAFGETIYPLEGEMVVIYQRQENALTVFLRFNAQNSGPCQSGTLGFRYDADKITAKLQRTDISLSPEQQGKVIRQNNADLKTLLLSSKEPCLVSCPQSLDDTNLRSYPNLGRLATLAKAETVNVVFDFRTFQCLRKEGLERLTGLIHGEPMVGVCVDSNDNKYRLVDLTHLSVVEEEISQDPPSYELSQEHGTLEGPPAGCEPRPRTPVSGGSTTEKATTALSYSPKPPLSPAVVLPDPNFSGSTFATLVKNAVETVLPGILQESLTTTYPESVINTIVEKLSNQVDAASSPFHVYIVNLVQTTLPDVLRDLPSLNNVLEEIAVAAFDREFNAAVSSAENAIEEQSQENQEAFGYYCYNKTNEFERELDAGLEEVRAEISEVVDCVKQCVNDELDDFRERLADLNGVAALRQDIENLAKTKTKLAKKLKRLRRMKKNLKKEGLRLGEERRKSEEERAESEKERRKLKRAIKKSRERRKEREKINLEGYETPDVGFRFRRSVAATEGSND